MNPGCASVFVSTEPRLVTTAQQAMISHSVDGWLCGSPGVQLKVFFVKSFSSEDSYIAGLVHVGEEPRDGHVADGLLEEHLLDGGRGDRAQGREEQEQLPEATGLSWVPAKTSPGNQRQPLFVSLSLSLRHL